MCLSVEELEALRLKDLEGLDQEECATRMGISRPTFQRILYAARAKVAEALVSGKAIRIAGGDFEVPEKRAFQCLVCGRVFELPFGTGQQGRDLACPDCGGPVQRVGPGPGPGAGPGGPGGAGRGRRFRGGRSW